MSGRLSERARDAVEAFSDERIVHAPPETIIWGPVTDETDLHEILMVLENLGLQLVSVQQIPDDTMR